jgi:hypothetical protein
MKNSISISILLSLALWGCGSKPEKQEIEESEEVGITNVIDKVQDIAKAAEQSHQTRRYTCYPLQRIGKISTQ